MKGTVIMLSRLVTAVSEIDSATSPRPNTVSRLEVTPPASLLVEVGGQEVARAVRQHGVDTDRVAATQVFDDRLAGYGKEGLVGA